MNWRNVPNCSSHRNAETADWTEVLSEPELTTWLQESIAATVVFPIMAPFYGDGPKSVPMLLKLANFHGKVHW